MDFGMIVLRDTPAHKPTRLDLTMVEADSTIHGFEMVPPGLHYVSVGEAGRWLTLEPNGVAVLHGDDLTPERGVTRAALVQLARSGALNLATYPLRLTFTWQALTRHLHADRLPLVFETELQYTYEGREEDFLAEFQYAFLCWLFDHPQGKVGLRRWAMLLQAVYGVAPNRMAASPSFFAAVAETLVTQFDQFNDPMFAIGNPLTGDAHTFARHLIETGHPDLIDGGSRLRVYIGRRREKVS